MTFLWEAVFKFSGEIIRLAPLIELFKFLLFSIISEINASSYSTTTHHRCLLYCSSPHAKLLFLIFYLFFRIDHFCVFSDKIKMITFWGSFSATGQKFITFACLNSFIVEWFMIGTAIWKSLTTIILAKIWFSVTSCDFYKSSSMSALRPQKRVRAARGGNEFLTF